MNAINIREARKHLSELVDAAEHGETVVITRHGRKVAVLVGAGDQGRKGLPDLTAFRAGLKIKGRDLSEEVLAMRREERS
jgi:prevent-host-death family protein